ncbi:MAG: cysteine--tRNA ligase [Fimbriimonadaceae bacterium]|nr:cysteine--tRNA ligase [Fimbriimonadaceae bacterium]
MPLHVYNTLHRRKELFEPLAPPRVRMYVCGPTVYGHSHVGHAKSYISFDLIVRWLRCRGYDVTYVQNITDVGHLTDDADAGEDKVVAEARQRGLHPMAIAQLYTRSYHEDLDRLNVLRPDIQPYATGHIPEQIELCRQLLAAGHAYEVNGSVYFDVQSFRGYGKLSGRVLDEVQAGARVAVVEEKRDARDFALWKAAAAGHLMQWPSPWGMGFPGWHLECSAMSMKYLGQSFDIHGGGLENQFPHHECEIAQSEGATGQQYVKYWLHNHMITVGGEKMGKSKGNFILIKDIIDEAWPVHPQLGRKYGPLVLRMYVLNSHYRSDLDFSSEGLEAAEAGLQRLHNVAQAVRRALDQPGGSGAGLDLAAAETAVKAALDDDFNSPNALAALFDLTRAVNTALAAGTLSAAEAQAVDRLLRTYGGAVLGLLPEQFTAAGAAGIEDALVQVLIDLRAEARQGRNFALADSIRDRLTAAGVLLEDRPAGTTWRLAG